MAFSQCPPSGPVCPLNYINDNTPEDGCCGPRAAHDCPPNSQCTQYKTLVESQFDQEFCSHLGPLPIDGQYCNQASADGLGYFVEECTSYSAWRQKQRGIPYEGYAGLGNARTWDVLAILRNSAMYPEYYYKNTGKPNYIVVNKSPAKGAVAQWGSREHGRSIYGHVGVVDSETAPWGYSDYNGSVNHGYDSGAMGNVGRYLHFNDGTPWPTNPPCPVACGETLPPPIILNNGIIVYWETYFGSNWELQLIDEDRGELKDIDGDHAYVARIPVATGKRSITIKNGQFTGYYEDSENVIHEITHFEEGRAYHWRIFNGKEYIKSNTFTFSSCPSEQNHGNNILKIVENNVNIPSQGFVAFNYLDVQGGGTIHGAEVYLRNSKFTGTVNKIILKVEPCALRNPGITDSTLPGDENIYANLSKETKGTPDQEPWVTFYPNPGKGKIYIEVNREGGFISRIDVLDICGALVKSVGTPPGEKRAEQIIDVSDLPDHLYHLRIETSIGTVVERLIIKK